MLDWRGNGWWVTGFGIESSGNIRRWGPRILTPEEMEEQEVQLREVRDSLDRAIRDGALSPCDIPACNCCGYHSRYASRMVELSEKADKLRADLTQAKALLRQIVLDWSYLIDIPDEKPDFIHNAERWLEEKEGEG